MAEEYEVVVLGAGAGGLAAASVAAAEGARTLLIEKSLQVGGTAAVSGGMVWVPANRHMKAAGFEDSVEAARGYLARVVPCTGNPAVLDAFLSRGPEAIDYYEARTSVKLRPVMRYPDYYPSQPGAMAGGRVLEPVLFDGRELGERFRMVRPPLPAFTLFGGMMVDRADLPHFRNVFGSLKSFLRVARLMLRHGIERLSEARGTSLVLGNALVARLLKSATDLGVEIRTGTKVDRLLVGGGRVVGVEVAGQAIRAKRGVVLATGGFSHSLSLRAKLLPVGTSEASPVCETNTGDGLALGEGAGGARGTYNTDNAYWSPMSRFRRPDGSEGVFPHTVADRGKPGIVAVTKDGVRFTSEAVSYHEFGLAMFRHKAIPAFLLCDRRSLRQYGLGAVRPFTRNVEEWIASGYLTRAGSVVDLAKQLGIDGDALQKTIVTYNTDAVAGKDSVFGIGNDIYQRHLGDAANRPNPCMRPISDGPFYAIRLYPSDLGTSAGLVTNEHAQVLDAAGKPIEGLYACGNDMNSIMNGAYPGPGITLGPALVFAYIAARHAAERG